MLLSLEVIDSSRRLSCTKRDQGNDIELGFKSLNGKSRRRLWESSCDGKLEEICAKEEASYANLVLIRFEGLLLSNRGAKVRHRCSNK